MGPTMRQSRIPLGNASGTTGVAGGRQTIGSNHYISSQPCSTKQMITLLICSTVAFYLGALVSSVTNHHSTNRGDCNCEKNNDHCWTQKEVDRYVQTQLSSQKGGMDSGSGGDVPVPRFGPHMMGFAVGMAKTTRDEFLKYHDYGYPQENVGGTNNDKKAVMAAKMKASKSSDVLILYQHSDTIPTSLPKDRIRTIQEERSEGLVSLSTLDALENCDVMNVMVTKPEGSGTHKQCLAIMEGYESQHLQRWMRLTTAADDRGGKQSQSIDSTTPFQPVGRGQQTNGVNNFNPPNLEKHIKPHWNRLQQYLSNLNNVLQELRPVVEGTIAAANKSSTSKSNKTLIVMVCNQGQSVLLHNFVCAAKSKQLDLSQVLVFATDPETHRLAKSLGLSSYYDEQQFGSIIPKQEAQRYGDAIFGALMFVKVVCVQLCLTLGYNVLFQDVDIVWYKHPLLELFETSSSNSQLPLQQYDIIFQDDGARSLRYAPYSANSGFYYVKHNSKTVYLFTSLLYHADWISSTKSHQQVLSALLTEYSSLYGLRVKTLDANLLPGGYHYHRQTHYMRQLLIPEYRQYHSKQNNNDPSSSSPPPDPYIFHMSWTTNKENKLRFMKQMGLWYVKDDNDDSTTFNNNCAALGLDCCSIEPIVSCFFKDKPSVIDCSTSPSIDNNGKTFWRTT